MKKVLFVVLLVVASAFAFLPSVGASGSIVGWGWYVFC